MSSYMTGWSICPRLPTVPEYTQLRASVGWTSRSATVTGSALARSLAGCCAEDEGGAVIGMARAVGDVLYVLVVDVVVRPDYQGRGIGTALVQRLVDQLPKDPAPIVGLHAAPDAVAVYQRAGFVIDPDPYLTIGRVANASPRPGAPAGR